MSWQLRRGTNAERTTFTPDAGELFWATDTKRLWAGDGSTSGGVDPFAADPYGDVFNVRLFGAAGDRATNDTAAVQAAVDAAGAAGGEVYFPPGEYLVTSTIVSTYSGISFRGSRGAALVSATNFSILALEDGSHGVRVSGLAFETDAVSGFTAGRGGISINSGAIASGASEIVIFDCSFSGLRTCGVSGGNCRNVIISLCNVKDIGEHGFYIAESSENVVIVGNTVDGVNSTTDNHSGIKLAGDGGQVVGNTIIGMDGAGSCQGVIIDCVSPPTGAFTITGNSITGCQQGVRLTNTSTVTVNGNTFKGNTLTGNVGEITVGTAGGDVSGVSCSGNVFHGSSAAEYSRLLYHFGGGTLSDFIFAGDNVVTGTYVQIYEGSGFWFGRRVITAAAGDTTPSVAMAEVALFPAHTGAVEITALDDALPGQVVTLVAQGASNLPTITDGGSFRLSAAWSPDTDDALTLFTADGSTWREISRSGN